MRHDNAAERVRRRITDWVKSEGHGSRKRLADAVLGLYGHARSASWITDVIDGPEHGGQDLRLRDLDAIAMEMGVPPGNLVRHDDNQVEEVTPTEVRLLRFYRALPDVVRHHLINCFDYAYGIQQQILERQAEVRDEKTADARRLRERDRQRQRKRKPRIGPIS